MTALLDPGTSVSGHQWEEQRAVEILRSAACPACRGLAESDRLNRFWFYADANSQPETVEGFCQSLGPCGRHTRLLLAGEGAPHVFPHLYQKVVGRALEQLARPPRERVVEPCPYCTRSSEGLMGIFATVLEGYDAPDVRRTYQTSSGFCGEHLIAALRAGDPHAASLLAVDALRHARPDGKGIERFPAQDPDWRRRASIEASTTAPVDDTDTSTDIEAELAADLVVRCCVACRRGAQAGRKMLRWLATQDCGDPIAVGGQSVALCAPHLHDFAAIDADAAQSIVGLRWEERRRMCLRFVDQLRQVPPRGTAQRWRWAKEFRGWLREHPDQEIVDQRSALELMTQGRSKCLDQARATLTQHARCAACHACDTAERRTVELLRASIDDPAVGAAYRSSVGLCARHVMRSALRADDPVAQVSVTRLRTVRWELEEAARRQAWDQRFLGPDGPEGTAWLRAPLLLDAGVFLGGAPHRPEVDQ